MRKYLRRPSPAMAVAVIALVVGASSTAVAGSIARIGSADIKDNSITTRDIRNNNIGTQDIRDGSLGSSDIGSNSLNGTDIDESTLGKVPAAANADTAANADKLGGKTAEELTASGDLRTFVKYLAVGESAVLAQQGQLLARATCTDNGGGSTRTAVEFESSVEGAWMSGDPLTANTPSTMFSMSDTSTYYDRDIDSGSAMAPDGTYIGIDGESLGLGVNLFGHGCVVAGSAVVKTVAP
jgi:hypothetical protein